MNSKSASGSAPVIWALTDGRKGNDNQTLALASRIGKHITKEVHFSQLGRLPNRLLGASLMGAELDWTAPYPEIVVSTGRKLARISAFLKKNHDCMVIHIMNPGKKFLNIFDFIIVPEHDDLPEQDNLIKIPGSISRISPLPQLPPAGTLNVTVLVGNITAQEAHELAGILNLTEAHYSITTSRRTKTAVADILDSEIFQKKFVYRYGQSNHNPYDEFLSSAHVVIATGDSVNMCTEAAHTGKPLYIYEVETKPKFTNFWQNLYYLKCARPLSGDIELWAYRPLNNLDYVMQEIDSRLDNSG